MRFLLLVAALLVTSAVTAQTQKAIEFANYVSVVTPAQVLNHSCVTRCAVQSTLASSVSATESKMLRISEGAHQTMPVSLNLTKVAALLPAPVPPPNPVPLMNQPLVPDVAAPGGAAFTLTVNGSGFVSGATVDWNGSPRITAFVSNRQLTATINAADIAAAGTASVTVANPTPGGGTSNVVFFTVTNPVSVLTFDDAIGSPVTVGSGPISVAVGDFDGDGIQDLAIANDGSSSVTILLGNGDGTFTAAAAPPGTFSGPSDIVVADYDGDGILDLAVLNGGNNTVTILLGNGDGTFFVPDESTPTTGSNPLSMVGGDFNGDGHMDLAVANYRSNTVTVLLGNGNGGFTATTATPATGIFPAAIVAGDFNNDGMLDLAVDNQCGTGSCAVGTVTILLGDGTGNFTPAQASPSTGSGPVTMAVADFNGDGNLDLAVPSDCGASGSCGTNGAVTVLLGDGTGNFTVGNSMPATGLRPYGVVVGDFDGDGNLDLATANNDSNTVSILLGDGAGNFTPIASPPTTGSGPIFPAVGDFNNDGLLDIAVGNINTNTVSVLMERGSTTGPGSIIISPTSLTFDSQAQGTTSVAQTVTVTNNGGSTVTFTNITTSGDFAGATLAQCPSIPVSDTPCTFQITFTPTAAGTRTGAITFTDNATGSPQTVTLTGTGAAAAGTVTLTPTSLTFATQTLNTTSAAQTVTVKNTGTVAVGLTALGVTGPFAIVPPGGGACTATTNLAAGASCTIGVTFTPTATGAANGALSVSDNATGSPQMATLSGTGAAATGTVTLTPTSLTFATQALNTTSAAQTVTVKNTGTAAVSITGFGATGPFAVPLGNTEGACGPEENLAAGASCTVSVTFTPTAAGAANGVLSVSDNATGSPQTATLTGTGQSSGEVVITVPAGGSTTATTVPGGTAFYGLMITGAPGVTGTATLGCISSSPLISCNVIPGSVVLTGGTVEVAFGVQTFCQGAPPAAGLTLPGGMGGMGTAGGLGLLMMGIMLGGAAWTYKGNRRMAMTLAMLLLMALGSAACGPGLAKGPNGITPAGTYTLTLTATVNGQTQTLPNFLTLVVN